METSHLPCPDPAVALQRLLLALSPVRLAFHSFLTDGDAAQVMRVSRSFTCTALSRFRFLQHVFYAETAQQLRRIVDFYGQYGMGIGLLHFNYLFNEPLIDGEGRPLLPSSLIAVAMGHIPIFTMKSSIFSGVVHSYTQQMRRRCSGRERGDGDGAEQKQRSSPSPPPSLPHRLVSTYPPVHGEFNQPLLAGGVPAGVRFLQLGRRFCQPLLSGSLPCSLLFLQLDESFTHALMAEPHVAVYWRHSDVWEVKERTVQLD